VLTLGIRELVTGSEPFGEHAQSIFILGVHIGTFLQVLTFWSKKKTIKIKPVTFFKTFEDQIK
jgi:hypothetical protein